MYGPDFDRRGIMSVFPPQPFPGQEYLLRVPQIDADGNTIVGLHYPDIAVPLGTYNGWALKAGFAEGEQWWNTGSFMPFARTKAEREARVREGLMLQEDADRFIAAARQKDPLDTSVRLGPLMQAGAYTGH